MSPKSAGYIAHIHLQPLAGVVVNGYDLLEDINNARLDWRQS